MDTIVIGAGLAGLAAAERLADAGATVTLLEARDRLGGRVWTERDQSGHAIDLGAEWIGADGGVRDLLGRAGVRLIHAEGRQVRRLDGGWRDLGVLADGNRGLIRRAAAFSGPDRSLRAALDACCAEETDARDHLLRYVQGFHAADPERVSIRWLTEVETTQPAEASDLRSPDGAGQVVEPLAASIRGRCDLRLGAVVRTVQWRPGRVEVRTADHQTFGAASAVITIPLPLFEPPTDESAAVRFAPRLEEKLAAARLMCMGGVVKVVLGFRAPFWHEIEPLDGVLLLHAYEQPIPTWWTPPVDLPILTGWAGGPYAERLGPVGEDELPELAIASLAHALGRSRRDVVAQLESRHFHDWSADPYTRGAYSYVGVGGFEAHRVLAEPVVDTLYFAGEATCGGGYNATMEGAVRSGRRAAAEVIRRTSRSGSR